MLKLCTQSRAWPCRGFQCVPHLSFFWWASKISSVLVFPCYLKIQSFLCVQRHYFLFIFFLLFVSPVSFWHERISILPCVLGNWTFAIFVVIFEEVPPRLGICSFSHFLEVLVHLGRCAYATAKILLPFISTYFLFESSHSESVCSSSLSSDPLQGILWSASSTSLAFPF